MPAGLIEAAVAYYGEFRAELDTEIALNGAESDAVLPPGSSASRPSGGEGAARRQLSTKAATAALADEIEAIMRANAGGLAGSERWL